jgi:outer membrane protein TolC
MKSFYISITLAAGMARGMAAEPAAATNVPPAITQVVVVLTADYISELAEEMRTNAPAILAAYSRTNAAAAELNAIRTWDDPMAIAGGLAAREEMRADEGDIIYGVEQKLPLFGKPGSARKVARAELSAEVATADYQFQFQRSEFAKAAFALALADQVVAIGEQDLAWLETMAQATDAKYRAGQAMLVELVQIENERARRGTQLQADRDLRSAQAAVLNRFLNRELRSPWPRFELPPLPGSVQFNARLLRLAMENEPRVQMMQQQILRGEAAVEQARRERKPDVNAGIEARNYSGDGSFRQGMFTLSMSLPWVNGGKYRNGIEREEARLKAAELDLADYRLSLREEVFRLTVKINSARREAILYRDQIIPRTQSALESARAGWESGQGTFRDTLDARRMLLEGRLMYARAAVEQYQMMSELVLCCGLGELGALSIIGAEPDEPETPNLLQNKP